MAAAVAAHVGATGETVDATWSRVRAYVDEIVPSFNLLAYYRLGYGVARLVLPLLYKVSVGHEPRAALNAIPRDSVVIYLMNHRSNADYVLVAYVLSGRVAVSYAVGEWARVWPLETLFKSFGSYFVRRRYPEPLYHKVLERYVQLITRHGVTQGVFIEGGLTRDGAFRPPKLGLLDYLARVKCDPGFDRPVFFVPVAINYDRVLEDRSLLRELQAPEERLRRRDQLAEVASYVLKVCGRFLLRRARRYGRACVNFGEPISLDEWLARHPGRARAAARGAAGPPGRAGRRGDGAHRRRHARDGGGHGLRLPAPGRRATRSRAWSGNRAWPTCASCCAARTRTSSGATGRAPTPSTGPWSCSPCGTWSPRRAIGFRVDRAQEPLLRYYANSIAHFLPAAGAAAG